MTVLTSESQLTWTPSATLPRVNLLPREVAERRAFRRIQLGLGAAVLASVGVVGILYVGASASASSAHSDLAAAKAQGASLQSETARYNDVTGVYTKAAAAQAALSSAMGDEIRYSQMLNDLSLTIPDNVWLKSLTFTAAAPAASAPGALPTDKVASMSASGVAFSHDDVAVLLESLMGLKTYGNAYFTNSTEALIGTRKTVSYTVTTDVTKAALSGRYTTPAGG